MRTKLWLLIAHVVLACTADAPSGERAVNAEPTPTSAGAAPQPAASSTPAPAPASIARCDEDRLTALTNLLIEGCPTDLFLWSVRALATSQWEAHDSAGDGIPVFVGSTGMGFEEGSEPLWSTAEFRTNLRAEMEKAREMFEGRDAEYEPRFFLFIDKTATLRQVADAVEALRAERMTRGWLVLASGTQPSFPPAQHPEAFAELVASAPTRADARARYLAERASLFVDACPAARAPFRAVAEVPADQRCLALARGVPKALRECGCAAEPAIVSFVQFLDHANEGELRPHIEAIELADGPAIAPASDVTWGDLVAGRRARFGKLAFAASGAPVPEAGR